MLEVGAADGWLSQRLAEQRAANGAAPLRGRLLWITSESAGAGALAGDAVRSAQPELLEERYPLVVINHGLHFARPIDLVRRWRPRLRRVG